MTASATCSTCRPSLRDWRQACADQHHLRAAHRDDGSCRACQHAGCKLGKAQVAIRPHQLCSTLLCVCACRDGTLLPVLYVCVSSHGSESSYSGRPNPITDSVSIGAYQCGVLVIQRPPGHCDPCGRKRVKGVISAERVMKNRAAPPRRALHPLSHTFPT